MKKTSHRKAVRAEKSYIRIQLLILGAEIPNNRQPLKTWRKKLIQAKKAN